MYRRRKLPVETVMVDNPNEIRGINSRSELAEVSAIMRQNKNEELMAAGVTIVDPATTYIDPDVEVGPDTVIHPGVVIQGQTRIGAACEIQALRPHRRLGIGEPRHDQQLLPHRWCARCRRRGDRAVCSSAARIVTSGRGPKSETSWNSRKRRWERGRRPTTCRIWATRRSAPNVNVGAGTITCNYDGETEAPDRHRRRRLHRQRHAADRAGPRWPRARTSAAGIVHHRRRAARSAGIARGGSAMSKAGSRTRRARA